MAVEVGPGADSCELDDAVVGITEDIDNRMKAVSLVLVGGVRMD